MDEVKQGIRLSIRLERMAQALRLAFWKAWFLFLLLTLCSIVFVAPFIWYPRKWTPPLPHGVLLVIAVVLGVLMASVFKRLKRFLPETRRGFIAFIMICAATLFALQIALTYAAGFYTDWDVAALIDDIWNTEDLWWYFSIYTNQVFLEGVFRRILRFMSFFPFDNEYQILVWFGCLSVSLSVALVSITVYHIEGAVSGFAAFAVTAFLWGLSPWILVPYSDAYGILWPIAIFFFYVCVEPLWLKLSGIVICSVIGYHIKPTVVFVVMAIVIIETLYFVSHLSLMRFAHKEQDAERRVPAIGRNVLACSLSVGLSFILVTGFSNWVENWGIWLDPDAAYSVTHYLMMGVNDSGGVWSAEDLAISDSYHTVADRQQGNIQEWKRRVKKLGPSGLAQLVVRKNLANYADGSFTWAGEGSFFVGTYGNNTLIKRFFGIREANEEPIPQPFRVVYHTAWLAVLAGIMFNTVSPCRDRRFEVIALSLMMLSVFLLVFECRARYLYLYGPLFATFSIHGWKTLLSQKRPAVPLRASLCFDEEAV